jgi:hypothetical protein
MLISTGKNKRSSLAVGVGPVGPPLWLYLVFAKYMLIIVYNINNNLFFKAQGCGWFQ